MDMRLPFSTLPHRPSGQELVRTAGFIDGAWVGADSGARFEVRNPADRTLVAEVPNMGASETRRAIRAAVAAFPRWRAVPPAQRSAVLRRWHELIVERADDLALLLTTEQGKPLPDARAEILQTATFVEWYAEEAKRLGSSTLPVADPARRGWVVREPVGVCAAITPWNYPASSVAKKLAPAFAAGCTIVLKPAEQTPLTALALAALAELAGLPRGVINVVTGDGSAAAEIGRALTDDPAVRMMSFTGSGEVGRELMRQCAATVKNLSLELGGHAPFIVFDDADLELAVECAVKAKFRNSGQMCVAANRFLIHADIYDAFAARLIERAGQLEVGPGVVPGVQLGPLIDELAVGKVARHIDDALALGARLLAGGKVHARGGTFFEPTILGDITDAMAIAHEETFGPVAPLMRFRTEQEAIAIANASEYGLASYLFSRDISRILRVTEALETGAVAVNTGSFTTEAAPFGGVKQSGLGREGGTWGLDSFLSVKHVTLGIG